jgi:hypothetical protein|tara:strand:- start:542 stop:688 length:147 start_codon:yes stop_codon:yes gene_type:complete
MSFLELVAPGVGLVLITIGLFIGLLYALRHADSKKNDIDDDEYDDNIY